MQLQQNADTETDPPLYGAGNSAAATAPISISPPSVTTTAGDFSAAFVAGPRSSPQIAITYSGHDDFPIGATDWSLIASNGSQKCGSTTSAPNPTTTIDVDPSCAGSDTDWTVQISYKYFLVSQNYTVNVTGTAPEPIDPAKMTFAGQWTQHNPQVQVQLSTTAYDQATLRTLTWTETVTSDLAPGVTCGQSTNPPQTDGSGPEINVNLGSCPPSITGGGTGGSSPPPPQLATYTLTVHYSDPAYGTSHDYTATITGTPPQ